MRAAAYTRVSTADQTDGTSLDAQAKQIRAYCEMKGIELVSLYSDAGVSGGKPLNTRPEGSNLTAAVERGEIQAVIILKLDRAFRNVVDCLQTIDSWEGKGVVLHIIDLGGSAVDSASPAGRFMLTVLSAAAEMERSMIRDRCNSGRKVRKEQGRCIGEVPYGFVLDSDTQELVKNSQEQEVVRIIRTLQSEGHSLRAIARELDRRCIPTKKEFGTWTHVQVGSILRAAA